MTDTALPDVSADATSAWREHNAAGLAHAHDGAWDRAEQAFVRALEAAPCFADAPDAHALLLANLAQARFHGGAWHEAVRLARQAEVARQVCGEEGDAPLARIRADLAVYLAATGDHDEARSLLRAARRDLEVRFGESDTRLVPLLENEVRLAMVAGAAGEVASVRERLQALLARRDEPRAGEPYADDAMDDAAFEGEIVESEFFAAEQREIDVFAGPPIDIFPTAEREASEDDLFGALEFEDEFDLIEPTAAPSIGASSASASASPSGPAPGSQPRQPVAPTASANPLGFEVQYGIPQDLLLDGDAV